MNQFQKLDKNSKKYYFYYNLEKYFPYLLNDPCIINKIFFLRFSSRMSQMSIKIQKQLSEAFIFNVVRVLLAIIDHYQ